jgi:hypothetical protein
MKALALSRAMVRGPSHGAGRYAACLGILWLGWDTSALAQQQATEVPAPAQAEQSARTEPAEQDVIPAVYKVREVSFSYNSSTSIYTCGALEARIKSIFLALGARDDSQIRVTSCNEMIMDNELESTIERPGRSWDPRTDPRDPMNRTWGRGSDMTRGSGWEDPYDRFRNRGTGREQNAHVRARLLMPVELTREVMAEVKRDKSRRELISRVTGDPTASKDDPVWFPAHRQPITLSRDSIGLEPEECELLDQMSTSVFKELGLRVTGKSRRCSRMGGSRTSPALTVEALVMAPVGETGLPELKLEGEGELTPPQGSDKNSEKPGQ